MTRPTDTEIAALLRELAKYLKVPDIELGIILCKSRELATRACAMANQLQSTEEES